MNDAALLEQVKEVAADVLGVSPSSLGAASTPETVESWDSVQHLSLVMALEQRFSISLDPGDIEKMKSIGEITSVVAAKTK